MKNTIFAFTLFTAMLSSLASHSQDEAFMYGKVYTADGKIYEGAIRWGKEEVFWTDIFNAEKEKNEYVRYLSSEELDALYERTHRGENWYSFGDRMWGWMDGKKEYNRYDKKQFTHQFACQFGDIKSLRPTGSKYVDLEMRDGTRMEIQGEGYNDIGTTLQVADKELGEIEVYWNRIDKVEFMRTPSKLSARFGEALYGTVQAFGKKYTGYIAWDLDERLSTDKLDGKSDDGKMSIEFGKIRSIERKGSRSVVVLKSGREFTLSGSNDVNAENRGIMVMARGEVTVNIPWDEFYKIDFEDKVPVGGVAYDDFKSPKQLSGKVTTTDGKTLSGRIVYDLDEAYDMELMQGKEGDVEFITSFREIKRVIADETRCTLELRNGKKIRLDEAQDVGELNQGVLVFSAADDRSPVYVPWEKVKEIEW